MAQTSTLDFHVWGPSKVSINLSGGTPNIDLGYTDNSDLISFELDIMTEPIMTTMMGNIPEQYIHMGTVGYLNMTLVKWSEGYVEDMLHGTVPDGAVEGDVGTVGKLRMGASDGQGTSDATFGNNFSVRVAGAGNGDSIDFHNCIIEGRGVRMMDFGNKAQRLALSFVCLPLSGSDGVHAGTDNIYTRNYA